MKRPLSRHAAWLVALLAGAASGLCALAVRAAPAPATAFALVVEQIDDRTVHDAGITTESLKLDAALRLRNAGLPVDNDSRDFLSVLVNAVPVRVGADSVGWAVNVTLSYHEPGLLAGQRSTFRNGAATWSTSSIYVFGSQRPLPEVREALRTLLDDFVQAWRDAHGGSPAAGIRTE